MRKKTETARGRAGAPGMRIQPFQIGLLGGLGVLLALAIGGVVQQLGTVLVYVGIALFLALGLDPVVSLLERKIPRGASIGAIVGVVLLAVGGILFAIIPVLIAQIENLSRTLPKFVQDVQKSQWFNDFQERYSANISDAINKALEFVQNPSNIANLAGGIGQVGTTVASAITGMFIVLILTLYFMASLRSMKQVATRFVPEYRRAGFADVMEDVTTAVGRYVIGQVSLASINGVLTLILALILAAVWGSPVPVLLALFAFIGSCIPLVGTLSAAIINTAIVAITALVNGSPLTPAIIMGIWYLVYMQIEAYIINPRIMSKAVAVPGVVVVIAAVAGGTLGGVLGALVAVPVAASIIIIVQQVIFPLQDAKTVAPAGPEIVLAEGD